MGAPGRALAQADPGTQRWYMFVNPVGYPAAVDDHVQEVPVVRASPLRQAHALAAGSPGVEDVRSQLRRTVIAAGSGEQPTRGRKPTRERTSGAAPRGARQSQAADP